jgi:hypothetical protein
MGHRVPFATPRLSRGDLGEAWLAPWSPAARRQTSPSSPPKGADRGPLLPFPCKPASSRGRRRGDDPPSWTPSQAGAVMEGEGPAPRRGSTCSRREKADEPRLAASSWS